MADETRKTGGDLIRDRREHFGWTQQEVANKADVSLSSVGRLERGQRIERKKEIKIAKALGWADHGIDAAYSGDSPIEDPVVVAREEALVESMRLDIGSMSDEQMRRVARFVAEVQEDPAIEFELMARMMRMKDAARKKDAESDHSTEQQSP